MLGRVHAVAASRSARTAERSRLRRLGDILLGKTVTLLLAALAVGLGVATFMLLARGTPLGCGPDVGVGMVLANLSCCCCSARCSRAGSRGSGSSGGAARPARGCMCGSSLLFSVVAVAPTIVVAVFATAFFHFGIQAWFNEPVRAALNESLQASRGYLEEHQNNIRSVALEMANDLARAGRVLTVDPDAFAEILANQTALRGLTEAVIYEPVTGQVIASAGAARGARRRAAAGLGDRARPRPATSPWCRARTTPGCARSCSSNSTPPLMLMIGRPIDPQILDHMVRTEKAVAEYERLDQNRSWLQIAFAWIFALVALLVLSAAVLIGLVMANQIARPIGAADPRGRAGARRRSCGARARGADRGRDRRPVARLQPHDRPARRPADRADGRL